MIFPSLSLFQKTIKKIYGYNLDLDQLCLLNSGEAQSKSYYIWNLAVKLATLFADKYK